MAGIPKILMQPLLKAIMDCDEFSSHAILYAIFADDRLKPFQKGLNEAQSIRSRADLTISYLADKYKTSGENGLVLLLEVLSERYDPEDERCGRLQALAKELDQHFKRPPAQESPKQLEANPNQVPMLHIADAEKMLACAQAVARVDVPKIVNGKTKGHGTGTAWLVAPGIALTCWHVIENRSEMDSPIELPDLEAQLSSTVLRFDFTTYGKGLEYGVECLETPTIETQGLDYAVLRLKDRDDQPVQRRGFLRLDADMPLNPDSSLYIIQHPLGQDQQSAGDYYVKPSPTDTHRILYKTPTEPGTSGSPVLNRVNWRVVALHNAENESEKLREGTLIRSVMADIQQRHPDLYSEIMNAQSTKE